MGPLAGIKVIEMEGLGPGPFCAMMLADMGAEVIRVVRKTARGIGSRFDVLHRGRRSISIDLKRADGAETVLRMIARADALVEGFRPGVMERLGLGPEECLKRNPRLIYGRMTGWGQDGPLAQAAAHDINFIALTGALHSIGPAGAAPVPPLNLVGDFGGGGMLLAFGIVCGILHARQTGVGQVIDAAMLDGSALLMAMVYGWKAAGQWSTKKGVNLLDGGAHFYNTYECADGKWVALGAFEPHFYAHFLQLAGIQDRALSSQMDRLRWPELKAALACVFKTKSRDEWCSLLEGTDACFAPVLDLEEAPRHAHNRSRSTFIEVDGVIQPAPAPRFSRSVTDTPTGATPAGQHTDEVLADWDFTTAEIANLKARGTI
ncbi:MAG: CaiB/BaiF CoA-transferase family protein [Terriglobales bacterium]